MDTNFQVFKEVLGTLSLCCSTRGGWGRGPVTLHFYAEHYLPLSYGPTYPSREFPSMDTLVDSLPHQMHLMHSDVIQPYPRKGFLEPLCLWQVYCLGKHWQRRRCYRQHLLIDLSVGWERTRWKGVTALSCRWLWIALIGYWIAILLTRDIPTVPGSFWVWIPPMSTNIRVRCYLLNCRRGTLKMYSALPPEGLNTITLTLVQPKAFKQHFARCEHSLSNSPDDSQAITVYDYTAGRCCLYRIVTNWSTHVLGPLITAGYAAVWFLARGHGGLSSRRYVARAGHSLIRIQEWPVACNLLCFSAWVANRPRPTCTSQAIQVHTWAFLFHCLSVIFRRCQYK